VAASPRPTGARSPLRLLVDILIMYVYSMAMTTATTDPERRILASYLAVQGGLAAVWWLALLRLPAVRAPFELAADRPLRLDAFLLSDALLFVVGSALGAWGIARSARWARGAVIAVAGGAGYASLYLVAWVLQGGSGGVGLVAMVPATVVTALVAWRLGHPDLGVRVTLPSWAFRPARPAGACWNGGKTVGQVVVAWTLALVVLPALADGLGSVVGLADWRTGTTRAVGITLLGLGSSLGLASAWVMVTRGRGTPVPFDAARDLVVTGPYRVVRNPMVVGGIAQSVGVALILGSWIALAIPIAGIVIWNRVLRPPEERFLTERFGASYQRYQLAVRCWVPTVVPYVDPDRREPPRAEPGSGPERAEGGVHPGPRRSGPAQLNRRSLFDEGVGFVPQLGLDRREHGSHLAQRVDGGAPGVVGAGRLHPVAQRLEPVPRRRVGQLGRHAVGAERGDEHGDARVAGRDPGPQRLVGRPGQ